MDLSLPGGLSNTTNIRNDDTFEFERRTMSCFSHWKIRIQYVDPLPET